jgi:hypothetical protein
MLLWRLRSFTICCLVVGDPEEAIVKLEGLRARKPMARIHVRV